MTPTTLSIFSRLVSFRAGWSRAEKKLSFRL